MLVQQLYFNGLSEQGKIGTHWGTGPPKRSWVAVDPTTVNSTDMTVTRKIFFIQ
ncbi:MAG TPA: hypothetical protein VKE71_01815 [Candidatus Angelobacter sp.]|nr:hypothetical protein [Candidatus Angelobacter sp.]